ncbi:leucine-rich repeat- and IQ domain-containing protein 1 [Paramisgurnus dabryanus]|uniref:leucine-rich repeat- and IQ domain-containing protein 1 n=1 Tax=Paramisgurnus dabryanus TaxID=90735 RepID=UPI0031F3D43A
MDDIDQAIDEELKKLHLDPSENDSEESEDDNFTPLDRSLHSEDLFSDSVLAYIEVSRDRLNAFEQFILEDIEEEESSSQQLDVYHDGNQINMSTIEDSKKWKEKVISEFEEQVGQNAQMEISKMANTDVVIDHDGCTETQLSLEWRELEKRLKEEEEQKLAAQEVERELHLNSEREDEERRRRSLMEFEEQLMKVSKPTLLQNGGEKNEVFYTVDQHELDKQQKYLRKLEKELEEEKQAFEKSQEEERKRTHELHYRAATKIQAALRGTLVRRWRAKEIKRKRKVEEKLEEEKREWEKIKKEREEEMRRTEEEQRFHREEMERRRAEYEASKELERHRLEKERRLEQQKKREEKDEQRRREMKTKEEQGDITSVKESKGNEESKCLEKPKRLVKQSKKEEEDKQKCMEEKEEHRNITSVKEESQSLEKEKRLEQQKKKEDLDEERSREREKKEEESKILGVKEETQCLEKEKILQQGKKEEEDEERRKATKRKEVQSSITSMEKRNAKEESRKQEEEKLNRENERRESVRSSRPEEECKRREDNEERGEIMIKSNENEIRERQDNKEGITNESKEEERNEIKKMGQKIKVEKYKDQKLQIMSNKDTMKNFQETNQAKSSWDGELSSQMDSRQSRNTLKVSTATPKSCIHTHQELSNELFGSTTIIGHLSSEVTDKSLNVDSKMETTGLQNVTTIELENCGPEIQELSSVCLPDSTEQKRLVWIKNCTPWSKLSLQNKKKRASVQQQSQKRRAKRSKLPSLPPLTTETILSIGAWSSLKEVTTVTLEDLPGCSLSTLSQCCQLQTLTLRRCGLRSLDGLNQCPQIRYIDVQENSISHVDCGGLANLQVLLLGKNQLMNIHGLDDAEKLQVLQLSHNSISRISGLGSLKMLLRLLLDHNQLLSTKGLNEIYTILHLDFSYNHLSHVEGLENCALLNTLDLRGNSLTELPVLNNHVLLRDLFLDDNLISSVHDLESYWLPLLQNLSVAHNSITDLVPLLDLVSLKRLDVSHNCLSDLHNVCLSLQGCSSLQELDLTDNPLYQENHWRSLLLETVPGLIKLNNEQTSATAAPSEGLGQQWSFQALCQAQQGHRESLLQRHKMEIRSAPSQHNAQLLVSGHHAELFRLAVDQRYAHEYGDSCVTEDPSAATESNPCDFSEASPSQSPEMEPQHTSNPLKLQSNDPQTDFPESCSETPTKKKPLNLKIAAAVVIQRCWRRYVLRRREGPSGLIAKTNQRSNIRMVEDWRVERPELRENDRAAIIIQAAWKGYNLRRRLAQALADVRITESDEDFEEVDTDEFTFDEKKMEKDWITLNSDASPARAMPYSALSRLPKHQMSPLMPPDSETPSGIPHQPKHAWSDSKAAVCLEQHVSPHLSSRSNTFSERSQKIFDEWGITSESTARLMLKRADRMKGRKPQQRRLLVHQVKNEFHNAPKAEEPLFNKERTYQRRHEHAVHPHTIAAVLGRNHFLPEIDHEIRNGGRVQLVASAGSRGGVDSGAKFCVDPVGVSPPFNKQTRARRHSNEHAKTEVPSPDRVGSAPVPKERISFRDIPVQNSGGWGGGKKRTHLNK